MFTIIGGDGVEYGPASVAQVRSWIAAGRANLETKAKAAGSDEWRRLGDYLEFAPAGEVPPVLGAQDAEGDDATPEAERWRRLLGAMIDGFLESLAWIPTSVVVTRAMTEMIAAQQFDPQSIVSTFKEALPLSLPYLGALLLIQIVLLTMRSQSVGNLVLGTRIVRVGTEAPGGFLRAFLLRGCLARVLRQVPVLGGVFWIVDSCFIFRDDRRCLHDLIAGTKVVKV